MNCFTHSRNAAVGMCAVCQKGVCHDCGSLQQPVVRVAAAVVRGARK